MGCLCVVGEVAKLHGLVCAVAVLQAYFPHTP